MDDGEININPEDINRLSDREKRELQIFLQGETQKAQVQKRMDALCPSNQILLSEMSC
jgi:hypothetical protein